MTETSVEYCVRSEYLRGIVWSPNVHTFAQRAEAEQYYDDCIRLEKTYGTPRNARFFKRTTTISSWEQVDRHA